MWKFESIVLWRALAHGSGYVKYYMRSMKLQSVAEKRVLMSEKIIGRLSADVAFDNGRFYCRYRVMRFCWWSGNVARLSRWHGTNERLELLKLWINGRDGWNEIRMGEHKVNWAKSWHA